MSDRERMEPELGQDLLDILPDRGLGRPPEREALSPRPLPQPRKKRKGWLLWLTIVILALVAAAASWMWIGKDGRQAGSGTDVPVVKADDRSYKSKPSQPGGMDVPDQDKSVYERFNNSDPSKQQQVERLLPPAEAPQAPPTVPQAAPQAPAAASPVQPSQTAQAPVLPDLPKGPVTESPKATPPSIKDTTPPEPAPLEPPAVDDKKAGTKAPREAAPPKIVATHEVPAKKGAASTTDSVTVKVPAAQSSGSGAWLVQLGAIKDEASASRQWSQIQKANSDLLGGLGLDVQRADLGAKGVFYRLRAGTLDSKEAAKALCQQLEARKQGCIVVHK